MKTDAIDAIEALHDIRTATNDVLKGYREMAGRAEPEIQTIIQRLTGMHEQHMREQGAELARMRGDAGDDSSLQGTLNKAVVIVRGWFTDLDRGVLPAVRKGEESLLDEYKDALESLQTLDHPSVVALLKAQSASIAKEIALLPRA